MLFQLTQCRRIEQVCAASLLTDIEELGGDVEQIFLLLFFFLFPQQICLEDKNSWY